MKNLHNDKETFNDILIATSNALGIEMAIVEKRLLCFFVAQRNQ